MESFSWHGLTRVFTGRKWEKVVWSTLLVGCMSFMVYLAHAMVVQYLQYHIRTEIDIRDEDEIGLPTITACPWVCSIKKNLMKYSNKKFPPYIKHPGIKNPENDQYGVYYIPQNSKTSL